MKYLNLLFLAVLFTLASCGEKEDLDRATVVKACEGTFLQIENTTYQVCNEDILTTVETGTKINVNIKHLDKCDEFQPNENCISVGPEPVLNGPWVKVIYVY